MSEAREPVLRVESRDGVITLTLNRPERRNALDRALRVALIEALGAAAEDPQAAAVIVTGAGDAFCAGLDLAELGDRDGAAFEGESGLDLPRTLGRCPIPIIAAVNGAAVTGGFELALCCDLIVASRRATFADSHARVGVLPGWGVSQRLARVVGPYRAKRMSLTGDFIDAETADAWGLVSCLVEPAELLPTAERLAREMQECGPGMVRAYKRVIDAGYRETLRDGLGIETKASLEHARGVSGDAIAGRRNAVIERGRGQRKRGS